jgi:hypothetical protein
LAGEGRQGSITPMPWRAMRSGNKTMKSYLGERSR